MRKLIVSMTLCAAVLALWAGCSTAPETESEKQELTDLVQATIARFKQADPSITKRFTEAKGYAIFPTVGKGGAVVGGAYGKGQLFEGGKLVGYCDLSQGSVGFQLGGQAYSEAIFFKDDAALKEFKNGEYALAAQASAVAAKAGASADADYEYGVMVVTMTRGGLMFEASVGGQKFDYQPKY